MGAVADFARMPTQRKVMVFGVIGALLGGVYFQFILKSLKSDLEDADGEHTSKVSLSAKLDHDIKDFDELKPKVSLLKVQIEQNEKALPTEAELPAFFETLNRKVLESGVEVDRWRQLPEEPIEQFVKVPVDIQLTGTFMEIKKFFASLVPKKRRASGAEHKEGEGGEDRDRVVSIENLTLTEPTVKNREIVLTAHFVATTYRQDEKIGAAAGTPGGPPKPMTTPAAPKAGTPAVTPAKPLPPASTPQGAKARVEDSLDKGDDRNRNAAGVDEAKTPTGTGGAAGSAGAERLKGGK